MNDIIVAISTAYGESGIAIVRLSGEGSVTLAQKLLKASRELAKVSPRTMQLFTLYNDTAPFDEALIVRFEKGSSYTGEESVEIQCHGGILPAQLCIETLCKFGARLAEPGEFTKRAFLNGRLDLTQAESVLGIIRAKSAEALSASERTLQGKFTRKIRQFFEQLTTLAARLEVNIDFPEDDTGLFSNNEFQNEIEVTLAKANELTARCKAGLLLREGLRVAIAGKPNVGKSSLLNALLKEKRAIVTELPGTTRDKIEEQFIHKGITVRITDTAGIRQTSDTIEALGIETALQTVAEADLTLWMLDASSALTEEDSLIGQKLQDRPYIVLLNKSDLPQQIDETAFANEKVLHISAADGTGIEQLKDIILDSVSHGTILAGSYSVSARQMECLNCAIASLQTALNAVKTKLGEDIIASGVAEARNQISALLGLDPTEKLLDTVFSDFCVGK